MIIRKWYSVYMRLMDDIKILNKINALKRELDRLSLQKYALDQACSHQSQYLVALAKLKSYGISEEQIISLGNTLQGKSDMKKRVS
jgi:prefoldin subunit 5